VGVGVGVGVDVQVGVCVNVAVFIVALVRVAVGSMGVVKGTSVGLAFPQPLRTSNTKKVQMAILIYLNIFLPRLVIKELLL
jgi:hypothetical protein